MTTLSVIKANMNSEKVFFRLLHNYSGVHVYVQVEKSRADAYRSEHSSLRVFYIQIHDLQQKNRVIYLFFLKKSTF